MCSNCIYLCVFKLYLSVCVQTVFISVCSNCIYLCVFKLYLLHRVEFPIYNFTIISFDWLRMKGLLKNKGLKGIFCELGMPILKDGVSWNKTESFYFFCPGQVLGQVEIPTPEELESHPLPPALGQNQQWWPEQVPPPSTPSSPRHTTSR